MTNEREIRVTFRKAVSDDSYGTEAAEVTLQDWMTDEYDVNDQELVAERMLASARRMVHEELSKSPSPQVRRRMVPVAARQPAFTAQDEAELSYPGQGR